MVQYCPVCMYPMPADHSHTCVNCGFDSSCSYESYPTLVPIPDNEISLLARRIQVDRKQKDELRRLQEECDNQRRELKARKAENEKLRGEKEQLERRVLACEETGAALLKRLADMEEKLSSVKESAPPMRGIIFPGSKVKFGRFRDLPGGTHKPISWIVLKVSGEDVLLITEEIPISQSFRFVGLSKSWKLSNPKKWLEEDFLPKAFDHDERSSILDTPYQGKVFLLDDEEAKQYFKTPEEAIAYPADHSEGEGGYFKQAKLPCPWWLRTGNYVNSLGHVQYTSREELDVNRGIRPVIWVKKDRLL